MPGRFLNVRYRPGDRESEAMARVSRLPGGVPVSSLETDESAARYYLTQILSRDGRDAVRSLAGDAERGPVPALHFVDVREQPRIPSRIVRFVETHSSVPIFGSQVIVELGPSRELISVSAQLAEVSDVSPLATVSVEQARKSIEEFTQSRALVSQGPEQNFYLDDQNNWHLVYLFRGVAAAPPAVGAHETPRDSRGCGPTEYTRPARPHFNYLVDAHSAQVVYYYSLDPIAGDSPVLIASSQGKQGLALPIATKRLRS